MNDIYKLDQILNEKNTRIRHLERVVMELVEQHNEDREIITSLTNTITNILYN